MARERQVLLRRGGWSDLSFHGVSGCAGRSSLGIAVNRARSHPFLDDWHEVVAGRSPFSNKCRGLSSTGCGVGGGGAGACTAARSG
jgi:hypothetical protein